MLMFVTCELSSFANTLDLELNGTDLLESRQNFCIKFVQKQNTNKQLCWTNVATECDVACLGSNTNTVINVNRLKYLAKVGQQTTFQS